MSPLTVERVSPTIGVVVSGIDAEQLATDDGSPLP